MIAPRGKRSKRDLLQSAPDNVRAGSIRRVANNTLEYWTNDGQHIYQHQDTRIVTINADGSIRLNSDGWRTVTTKERINRYLPEPWTLFQDKSIWYLGQGWNDPRIIFYDGIILTPNGDGSYSLPPDLNPESANEFSRIRAFSRMIRIYKQRIMELESLPRPDSGDCWRCLMRDTKTGQPWGEATGNVSHLENHLTETYVHGSLIINALEWAGYGDPSAILMMDLRDRIAHIVGQYFKAKLGIPR